MITALWAGLTSFGSITVLAFTFYIIPRQARLTTPRTWTDDQFIRKMRLWLAGFIAYDLLGVIALAVGVLKLSGV